MLFQCCELDNSISLKNVLLHGLIRDKNGIKMSKSLGNVVDPLQIIDEHGADSLKLFLISSTTMDGNDINFSIEKLIYCKTFINKL
jgi:valyl-tRNA synthetase